jgi:4-amino-4-deoxy-L-arabinose transferase-like glycosyltransferase
MDPAILIPPAPADRAPAECSERRPGARRSRIRGLPLAHLALGGVLIASLGLRLWGIKQGLPYSYNSDEATHFVPQAVGFLGGDFNPHYFLNPPAYTYLLYLVLAAWFGGGHALHQAFVGDPTSVYVVARVVAALLSTASVWLTYLAGARLFGRWAAVLAAAVLGLAFLPVFYSHLALNDAPVLAPVALALWGVARIASGRAGPGAPGAIFVPERRHADAESQKSPSGARDYALAGLGVGLAAATKYTGGIVVVCLLGAFAVDAGRGDRAGPARRLVIGLVVAAVAFLIANPYALLNHHAFLQGIRDQASAVGVTKLGTSTDNGWLYYLWTYTWGLGWVPALAGTAGGVLLLARRHWAYALALLPAPLIYILYMGAQERFFGRWLMPIFPIVALLAGCAVIQGLQALQSIPPPGRGRRWAAAVAGAIATALLLTQSVAADIHNDAVLSRPDTRNLARAWMVAHIPAGAKVVIEPVVPDSWGRRWRRYPTAMAPPTNTAGRPRSGPARPIHIDQYESYLAPSLLIRYVSQGYCWVLKGSQQSGRAFARPAAAPGAVAYYAALAGRGRPVYRISPYGAGSSPPAFNFDWSFDYYPRQYRRPGPAITIYRLTGGDCGPG